MIEGNQSAQNGVGAEGQAIIQKGMELADKAIDHISGEQGFMEQVAETPVEAISGYATTYTKKMREGGMNDLATLAVTGSLIITELVNILSKSGIDDGTAEDIQAKAQEEFMREAIKNDRAQNGFTEENTPPDENGQVPRKNPEEGGQPPASPPVIGG